MKRQEKIQEEVQNVMEGLKRISPIYASARLLREVVAEYGLFEGKAHLNEMGDWVIDELDEFDETDVIIENDANPIFICEKDEPRFWRCAVGLEGNKCGLMFWLATGTIAEVYPEDYDVYDKIIDILHTIG